VFIGYFTERPYQDPESGYFGATGKSIMDLTLGNGIYNREIGAELYNRYLDEKIYAEEVGFDGLMLNEHHSTPFCMGGTVNVEAAILARITSRPKIVLLGNVLPLWDDPLWLVEQLATIDLISRGRLVAGVVRGGPRESVSHNINPAFNRERFEEAHDFMVKAWTTPGPFRWEGKHYNYRYVNPFVFPYQQPHPPIWVPGVVSRDTVAWAARKRYPYVMLATALEPTRQTFDYYREVAREAGYEAGTQHISYLFKVHVDETEELADQTGRKYVQGPSNPFLAGNEGTQNAGLMALPGHTSRSAARLNPTAAVLPRTRVGGTNPLSAPYETQAENYSIISGTPPTVIKKVRHVLETLRPGSIFFWDGDGAMTHDDSMRSLRLFGQEVLPAVREIGVELDLKGPFEVDPITLQPASSPALPQEEHTNGVAHTASHVGA
jgi:alkanesulfonate monooxygenase SsuD/methylene tetrahydromethanopterin reductase-like flavin-dependent oxidoreductase (luciferase family)